MPSRPLTARFIDAIKPTPTRVEYFDRTIPGLALRVTPAGAKSWTVLYRNRHGRLRRLTLGSLDVLTLADARDQARDKLHEARHGVDPAALKRADRHAETITDLVAVYLERHAKPHKRSWKADERMLRKDILPRWGQRAVREISRRDCLNVIEAIADRGSPIMANRTAALLSSFFRFALDGVQDAHGQPVILASPAVGLRRPAPEHRRDRVLSDEELRKFWRGTSVLEASMAAFFRLRLLTAQRGHEVGTMRWADVNLSSGWWTVPAGISKNKLSHRVPLGPQARAVIAALQPKGRMQPAAYVLTGGRGKRQQAEAAKRLAIDDFRAHDLRRTAASLMASGGVSRLVIAKILNHVERDVTAVYDRYSYDAEKQAALTWWDARLRGILAMPRPESASRRLAGIRSAPVRHPQIDDRFHG